MASRLASHLCAHDLASVADLTLNAHAIKRLTGQDPIDPPLY
jgi:hypothetical protein